MYQSLIIIVLFMPLILSTALIDKPAPTKFRYRRVLEAAATKEKNIKWILTEKKFIGRHPCALGSVCDCWLGEETMKLAIDCSNRNLTEPPKMIDSLHITMLDLSGNALRQAPNMTKEGYSTVHSLFLNDNLIENITENLITPELRVLDLSGNKISRVEEAVLIKLFTSNVLRYDLNYNPWICDCQSIALYEFAKISWDPLMGLLFVQCANAGNKWILSMDRKTLCPDEATTMSPVIKINGQRYRKSEHSIDEPTWLDKWGPKAMSPV